MENEYLTMLTETEQRSKSNTKRIDRAEERLDKQDDLLKTLSGIQKDQQYMREDVDEIKTDVKALSGKSGKLWDETTRAVLIAIVTAIAAFLLGKLL